MHHWAVIVLAGWVMWIETIASLEPGEPLHILAQGLPDGIEDGFSLWCKTP
jgi:hypothetical protein